MNARRFRWFALVAAALILHVAAHLSVVDSSPLRTSLPEDGPVLVRNPALATAPSESVSSALARAWTDPAAAWEGGSDTVGRARWRPVAATLGVLERAVFPAEEDAAARGAAALSLVLHLLVVLGTSRLVLALGGDERAALVAGLLAAASPVALAAAAWPARQATVLAAALALGGTLVAIRGGTSRLVLGGALIAAAGLAHEMAFGFVLVLPLLRPPPRRAAWLAALAPVAALVARGAFLHGLGSPENVASATALRSADSVDGATGILAAMVSFAIPARSHFADGPFVFSFLGHAVALAILGTLVVVCARRLASPVASVALASVAALAPLLFVSVAGGAPFQDGHVYMALPLLATCAALIVSESVARGGALRIAAVAAAALLLGASVAATVTRAPSFRTRRGLVALAVREMPQSQVVRSWDLAQHGSEGLAEVASAVRQFANEVVGDAAPRLRGDAVAAATISRFLMDYAGAVGASKSPGWSHAAETAEAAAAAATVLRPQAPESWLQLARIRSRNGATRGAYEALGQAGILAHDRTDVVQLGARISLALGNARFAAEKLDAVVERESEEARREKREVDADLLWLYATALAADGAARVPDPASDRGMRWRYDLAVEMFERLMLRKDAPAHTRGALYEACIRYGDFLVSIDRTAMARYAYQRAFQLTNFDPKQMGAQHLAWLDERLSKAISEAGREVEAAQKGDGNVADAMAKLYVALCRGPEKQREEADALFAKLEKDLGGIPPALRLQRAVERYAALEDPEDQQKAETELQKVIEEEPALARAHFELARVLEWEGTLVGLERAQREYEKAVQLGPEQDFGLDADQRAQAIRNYLANQPK